MYLEQIALIGIEMEKYQDKPGKLNTILAMKDCGIEGMGAELLQNHNSREAAIKLVERGDCIDLRKGTFFLDANSNGREKLFFGPMKVHSNTHEDAVEFDTRMSRQFYNYIWLKAGHWSLVSYWLHPKLRRYVSVSVHLEDCQNDSHVSAIIQSARAETEASSATELELSSGVQQKLSLKALQEQTAARKPN